MSQIDVNKLKSELGNFHGTENYYYLPLFERFKYTDGVKYLAEQAGAYWLLEYIFSAQADRALRGENFQVWKVSVLEDNSAIIKVEDGNDNLLAEFNISLTDFPLKRIDLWLIGQVLILPSEY